MGPGTMSSRTRPTIVIVGHGMVGNKVLDALVRKGATRTWDVVVVGEESRAAYDRVHLSTLFDGASPTDLALGDPAVATDPAVTRSPVNGPPVSTARLAS